MFKRFKIWLLFSRSVTFAAFPAGAVMASWTIYFRAVDKSVETLETLEALESWLQPYRCISGVSISSTAFQSTWKNCLAEYLKLTRTDFVPISHCLKGHKILDIFFRLLFIKHSSQCSCHMFLSTKGNKSWLNPLEAMEISKAKG